MDNIDRFSRTRLLLGNDAFDRLTGGHVAIIGLGAVGAYAMEGLARAGIGKLTLVDFDTIHPSNINRQLLAMESTIGESKTAAALKRVHDINPLCSVQAYNLFADDQTITKILDLNPDVLVDAIDSLNPKFQILTACHRRHLKIFSSMGAALRRDPLLIRVGDISETRGCPLARRLRKRLRSSSIISGITCVYSMEPVDFDYLPPDTTNHLDSDTTWSDRGRARRTLGSLPTLTAMFGLILANEVIAHFATESP